MDEYDTKKYTNSVTVDLNSSIKYLYGEMQLYKIRSQFIPHHNLIICSSDVNFNTIRIRASLLIVTLWVSPSNFCVNAVFHYPPFTFNSDYSSYCLRPRF